MKRKCLDRDVWWKYNKFEDVLYYQIRVDMEDFHGWVGLIQLNDGTYHYWDFFQKKFLRYGKMSYIIFCDKTGK
jgi:hypothetical protein